MALSNHPHLASGIRKTAVVSVLRLFAFIACSNVKYTFTLTTCNLQTGNLLCPLACTTFYRRIILLIIPCTADCLLTYPPVRTPLVLFAIHTSSLMVFKQHQVLALPLIITVKYWTVSPKSVNASDVRRFFPADTWLHQDKLLQWPVNPHTAPEYRCDSWYRRTTAATSMTCLSRV